MTIWPNQTPSPIQIIRSNQPYQCIQLSITMHPYPTYQPLQSTPSNESHHPTQSSPLNQTTPPAMIVDQFQSRPTIPSNSIHPQTQSPIIIYQQSTHAPTDRLSQTFNQNQDKNSPTNAKTQNPFLPCQTKVSQK